MSELKDIKAIKPEWIPALLADSWTVKKLATADISRLTPYPGIGEVTAQKIIGEARQRVNWDGYSESRRQDATPANWGIPPSGPKRMSVRLQRIKDKKK